MLSLVLFYWDVLQGRIKYICILYIYHTWKISKRRQPKNDNCRLGVFFLLTVLVLAILRPFLALYVVLAIVLVKEVLEQKVWFGSHEKLAKFIRLANTFRFFLPKIKNGGILAFFVLPGVGSVLPPEAQIFGGFRISLKTQF